MRVLGVYILNLVSFTPHNAAVLLLQLIPNNIYLGTANATNKHV